MFEAYTTTTAAYTTGTPINFPETRFSDCRVIERNSNTYVLKSPGRYYISFTGTGSSSVADAEFSVQLYKNGEPIPGTLSVITSAAADERLTLSTDTIVHVAPSCCAIDNRTSIQVVATSTSAGSIYDGSITILKVR